ncbi:MAG: alpha/beta fold hydrolase [Anaerolineae bacterium]
MLIKLIRSPITWVVALLALGGLNFLAYRHAYAMLNFRQAGERTPPPEALTRWQKLKILLNGIAIPKPQNHTTPASLNLPFEVHHITIDENITLEAWHMPHPRPKGIVVMFHGYAAAKSGMLPEAQAFYKLGYSTFLVDFRGSGGSSESQTSLGFYEAEAVTAAVAYARQIFAKQPLILYGQSMGAAAILRAVSVYGVKADALIIEAVFDRTLSTVQNRFAAIGWPAFPAAQLLIFWGGVQLGYNGFSHNPADYATTVVCPTLMLHGADDPRATLRQAQAVFQNLSGPKQFEIFAGVKHESYLAAQPERWKQTVSQFLKQRLQP